MKLETKTTWQIHTTEQEIKKNWTSNESLVTRLEKDFFNPKDQLVGKSPEYIIGYFLEKIMTLQKELEEKDES